MNEPADAGLPGAFLLRAWWLTLVILTIAGPENARAQDELRFLRWAAQDPLFLARHVAAQAGLYAAGGAVVLVPLAQHDPVLARELRTGYRLDGAFAAYVDAANELGGPPVTAVTAAVFGASLLTNDARLQDAAFTSLEALVLAGAFGYGLKYTIGRFRPEQHRGAYRVAPFSGNTSFPSGHTTAAFAVLTPWAIYYPNAFTRGLLVLGAGGTALARIGRDKHWATDVLAGGALGLLTAARLSHRHLGLTHRGTGARLSLAPAPGPAAVALGLRIRL